jgi:hypothetical protein
MRVFARRGVYALEKLASIQARSLALYAALVWTDSPRNGSRTEADQSAQLESR